MPPFEYVSLPNLFSVSVFGFAVRLAKLSHPFLGVKIHFTVKSISRVIGKPHGVFHEAFIVILLRK